MTNSLGFPNMIDVAHNSVNVLHDNESILNRCKLLILTEENELYNSPDYGVGLKRHLWKYISNNERAIIRDRIAAKLRVYEPCCDADKTSYANGLISSDYDETDSDMTHLKMTISIRTILGDDVSIDLSDLQQIIDRANSQSTD